MIDLGPYQFSDSGKLVVKRALEESQHRGHTSIGPEHLFTALIDVERGFFNEVVQRLNRDPDLVIRTLDEALRVSEPYTSPGLRLHPLGQTVFRMAYDHARQRGRQEIGAADLFVGLFQDRQGAPADLLRQRGADRDLVLEKIMTRVNTREEN